MDDSPTQARIKDYVQSLFLFVSFKLFIISLALVCPRQHLREPPSWDRVVEKQDPWPLFGGRTITYLQGRSNSEPSISKDAR